MNNTKSFTFYRDYYNLIDTISIKDKKEILVAIVDYVFKDIEPKLIGHNQAIFNTLKNQLSKSKNNSKRSINHTNQTTNQIGNQNNNQSSNQKETKQSVLSFKFLLDNNIHFKDRELLRGKISEWLDYKWERKEYYKEKGFDALLTQIKNNVDKYGEENVINLITECMANNYKGIIFDKLKNQKLNNKKQDNFTEVLKGVYDGTIELK